MRTDQSPTTHRRHLRIWMGLFLTICTFLLYKMVLWVSALPDLSARIPYIPEVVFVGPMHPELRPVAAGDDPCNALSGTFTVARNGPYQCSAASRGGAASNVGGTLTVTSNSPDVQLLTDGTGCNIHWFSGTSNIRTTGACFSNMTIFTGGGSSISGTNGLRNGIGETGYLAECTIMVSVGGAPKKCSSMCASSGTVGSVAGCRSYAGGNFTGGGGPAPQQTPPPFVPTYYACGEHTEPDRTCNGSTRTHTVRHEKYCENGQEKLRSVYCDNPAGKWEWVDYTSVVQSDMGKWGGTMSGCENEHPDCSKSVSSNPPAPTLAPRPTTAPQPTAAPPPVVVPLTAIPTAIPVAPTVAPPVPVSNQGFLQVAPLSMDSTYYLSFSTSPGNVAFGLYFANGADISLENQVNNALALQGISVPTFKNQTANASMYDLPFLINDSSMRLSFTLYRRPKKDVSQPVTISTFIEQSKGCLSAAMPNTYVIDITILQSNTPCR